MHLQLYLALFSRKKSWNRVCFAQSGNLRIFLSPRFLCEIKSCHFRILKMANLDHICTLSHFWHYQIDNFSEIKIQSLQCKIGKMAVSNLLKSAKLISRKILVAEKSLNLYTVIWKCFTGKFVKAQHSVEVAETYSHTYIFGKNSVKVTFSQKK